MAKKKIKFIDLFAGIWWFHIAFRNAWAECVFASEWNENARKTYETNFRKESPEIFESGNFAWDITKVDENNIPEFDILTWWFPCQPFSQAGHKKWFNETRWTLFFDIARIIKANNPDAFFIENVRWLLTHDNWNTYKVIKETIEDDLKYSFFSAIIKASDFWLPQHRPRLFMVWFKDKNIKFEFPKPISLQMTMSDIWWGDCNKTIWYTLRLGWKWSWINDRRNWDWYIVNWEEKRLTPKEWKKMQGFPDDFKFPVSNNEAMKQLGNSVAIPAIQAVAESIINHLKNANKRK